MVVRFPAFHLHADVFLGSSGGATIHLASTPGLCEIHKAF